MTEERKAKIDELLSEGYVDGATCVAGQHRNHDVWASLLVKPEEKKVVCKRCFKAFNLDPRFNFCLKSSITKHSRTMCDSIKVDIKPDGPLYPTHPDPSFNVESNGLLERRKWNSDVDNDVSLEVDVEGSLDNPEPANEISRQAVKATLGRSNNFSDDNERFNQMIKDHHRILADDRPYSCNQCDLKFTWVSNLRRHERTHTGVKLFKCSHCDYKTNTKGNVTKHEARLHSGKLSVKLTPCPHCEKKFSRPDDLPKHLRNVHNIKPFSCSKCGEEFARSAERQLHKYKFHNKPKTTRGAHRSFCCSICGKMFRYEVRLREHEQRHRANPGGKQYTCPKCDKKFTSESKLRYHDFKIHGGIKHPCSYCGKNFSCSTKVREHERIHTGEKPFSCPHCDYRCTMKHHLKVHKCNQSRALSQP